MSHPDRIFLLAVLVLCLAGAPAYADAVYWADTDSASIQRLSLDGNSVDNIVEPPDSDHPRELVLDPGAGYIYWTDYSTVGLIRRARLTGGGVEDLVGFSEESTAGGVALDRNAGKLYYSDTSDCVPECGSIRRSDLDGTNEEMVVPSLNFPTAIAVDATLGIVCWSSEWDRWIQCAQLDGEDVRTVVTDIDVGGISIDPGTSRIYWTEELAGRIRRAGLDGANVEDLITTGLDRPHGLDLDRVGGKIYWSDSGTGEIWRASLDGSDMELLIAGTAPLGVAFEASGSAVPALSGLGLLALMMGLLVTATFVLLRRGVAGAGSRR